MSRLFDGSNLRGFAAAGAAAARDDFDPVVPGGGEDRLGWTSNARRAVREDPNALAPLLSLTANRYAALSDDRKGDGDEDEVSTSAALNQPWWTDPRASGYPGSRFGRNSYGAPGTNYVLHRRAPIMAHYRTSTIPPQTSVVCNCVVDRPNQLYDERKRWAARFDPGDLLAPVGTEQCFRAIKGELAYSLVNGDGIVPRDSVALDGTLRVFTTVNGLSVRDRVMFAGYLAFNQEADHQDPVGTLVIAGTQQVVHTGPFPIRAGQLVIFSPYPYIRVNDNGQTEPMIREVGTPGAQGEKDISGVSLAKYKPALYGIQDQDTMAFIRSVEKYIARMVAKDKIVEKIRTAGGDQLVAAIAALHSVIQGTRFLHDPPVCPMRNYAQIYLWRHVWAMMEGAHDVPADKQAAVGNEFYKIIEQHFNVQLSLSSAFKDALGSEVSVYKHLAVHHMTKTLKKQLEDDNQLWQAGTGAAGAGAGTATVSAAAPLEGTPMRFGMLLLEWSRQLLQFYQEDQEDFLRSCKIGYAMRDCQPGKALDLMLGYHWR